MTEMKSFIKNNMPMNKSLKLMAIELGVKQPTVSNWLKREKIPTKYLFEVADYLEIEPRSIKKIMKFK